ncbi:M3 family metallopeptidase [Gordonia rubripertincta]|uniref:M3 family metallopeptidase n=1 Tax=Gordonia rubripertincta TaxID=36822 RepID=A0ABT4MPC2_GORRU|nr:M3 family metallopeptidase [Gordonia rubripertincta]MCZ4548847.1 M3 family metallopeptidase [Gordonia rubripertincta]
MSSNPVLAPSPHLHGLPDFPSISDDDFLPAFDEAMAAHLREVEKIAGDKAQPTFANTIEALETSGQLLARAAGIFFNLSGADTNPERNNISTVLAPKLTAHGNTIALHPGLFARINTLFENRESLDLDEPSLRLLEKRHRGSIRAGAGLDDAGQVRMREISERLATLTTSFGQRILDDSNDSAVLVDDVDKLAGLSSGQIAAARRSAAEAGHDSGFLLAIELPTSQSTVASLEDPETRRRVFDASVNRCARGGPNDTREMVLEIVRLRAERARLLGYRDHAEFVIAEETAPSPEAVEDLLTDLMSSAMRAGGRELTRLAKDVGTDISPSDLTYWLAKDEQQRSAVPLGGFSDYLELDRVLTQGVFFAAGQLYGLRFIERAGLPTYHPDVRVWEVFDRSDASIGLFLGDFFARPSKRGGAWMNNFIDQSLLLKTRPVIVNVLNLTKPEAGQPCLLTMDQLTTLFHEFGHALHGLLSTVRYPSQSGTSVPRDFVEFPSQVNEMWALHPKVLQQYAKHHETGAPIPQELADAARANADVESAHGTIEYLAAAILDMAWHRVTVEDDITDVEAFEKAALTKAGAAADLIPPRYRSAYFNHIFGGGYSAGYYSYIWSEVLDAETEQWFLTGGGLSAELGQRFAETTLSRGDSVDPIVAHQELLGRPAEIDPLLRRRGLLPT